ncbi:hypothetical protein GUITHDRAFT_146779 [Guillardia theta CCMP2712]|uniref:Uncharacterized protein n=1 Tax=Guillardia theta (strain CCMP2712) TaxID=905079 RepID=L1IG14_GUITC|nr:hypothetical protein GUITHDRAFT_146779 [Guillardia theta CCMP2712]EKX35027.1 hypothetical protein GUITHDRAFT_146779 [Guillardia theta CCMP2712]|eukprot:XP_005822007.1 hypothetical protein GUITHDRAFT_146779 [Guillardia theta CCMP2712]
MWFIKEAGKSFIKEGNPKYVEELKNRFKEIQKTEYKTPTRPSRELIKKMNNAIYTASNEEPDSNVLSDDTSRPLFDFRNPSSQETIVGRMMLMTEHAVWYQHSTKQTTSDEGMLKHDSISTYNMMVAHAVLMKMLRDEEPDIDPSEFMFAGFDPSLAFHSGAQEIFNNFLGAKMKKQLTAQDRIQRIREHKQQLKTLKAKIIHRYQMTEKRIAALRATINMKRTYMQETTDPKRKKSLEDAIKRIELHIVRCEEARNMKGTRPIAEKTRLKTMAEFLAQARKGHNRKKKTGSNQNTKAKGKKTSR